MGLERENSQPFPFEFWDFIGQLNIQYKRNNVSNNFHETYHVQIF